MTLSEPIGSYRGPVFKQTFVRRFRLRRCNHAINCAVTTMPAEKNFGKRFTPDLRKQIEEKNQQEPFVPEGLLKSDRHLIGSFRSGVPDLSTNKKYMEGYGE